MISRARKRVSISELKRLLVIRKMPLAPLGGKVFVLVCFYFYLSGIF